MVTATQKSETVPRLVEQTVSKEGATLEVKLVEIPEVAQEVISTNLERGKEAATQRAISAARR